MALQASALAAALAIPALYALALLALTTVSRELRRGRALPPTRPDAPAPGAAPSRKAALEAFCRASGQPSFRAAAEALGIPKATLGDWLSGRGSDDLDARVRAALAKPPERD